MRAGWVSRTPASSIARSAARRVTMAERRGSDDRLAAIERFGEAARRVAADAAQPQQGQEGVGGEPCARPLAREMLEQRRHLAPGKLRAQGGEQVGVAEIAVIFDDLVLPDEMVAEGVVGELGDQAMVLMQIIAVMREDQRRLIGTLQRLEALLDLGVLRREEAVAEVVHRDRRLAHAGKEMARARLGLAAPRA